jgi:hypothetical protein
MSVSEAIGPSRLSSAHCLISDAALIRTHDRTRPGKLAFRQCQFR